MAGWSTFWRLQEAALLLTSEALGPGRHGHPDRENVRAPKDRVEDLDPAKGQKVLGAEVERNPATGSSARNARSV
jgi:hypothetical protein